MSEMLFLMIMVSAVLFSQWAISRKLERCKREAIDQAVHRMEHIAMTICVRVQHGERVAPQEIIEDGLGDAVVVQVTHPLPEARVVKGGKLFSNY